MSIRLSPRYGVNPGMIDCFICGQATNALVLYGHRPGDAEAPRRAVDPDRNAWCDACRQAAETHVHLIEVDEDRLPPGFRKEGKSDLEALHAARTGWGCAVSDELLNRLFDATAAWGVKHRYMFVDKKAIDHIGLPRGEPGPAPEAPDVPTTDPAAAAGDDDAGDAQPGPGA